MNKQYESKFFKIKSIKKSFEELQNIFKILSKDGDIK